MSRVAKAAVGLMAATLVAKILGFGRELALASAYGASGVSDAFLVAMNIPAVIFTAIGTSLGTAFIPLYCEVNANKGEQSSNKFTNNVFNIVVIICLVLSVIGAIFTPQIVKIFAVGFEGETLRSSNLFYKSNDIRTSIFRNELYNDGIPTSKRKFYNTRFYVSSVQYSYNYINNCKCENKSLFIALGYFNWIITSIFISTSICNKKRV